MAGDDFKLNYKGMGEYLAGREMLKMVLGKVEEALVVAVTIAPEYTGEYKTEFGTRVEVREGKHPRACGILFNSSDHAMDVEFGRGPTPRHRTLGKAIGAIK